MTLICIGMNFKSHLIKKQGPLWELVWIKTTISARAIMVTRDGSTSNYQWPNMCGKK